jgi:glycosyltransferase involved in cell wall biosynthesis
LRNSDIFVKYSKSGLAQTNQPNLNPATEVKILLIGEYSRLHNSLKEGLRKLGHEVTILGYNDGFKDYPVDYKLERKWNSGIRKKIKGAVYKTTGFDITSWITYKQFFKMKEQFTGFDIVQLINENSFYCEPLYEKRILAYLFANNKKVFLLSCGDDYLNVDYHFRNPEIKSILQPYFWGKIGKKDLPGVLKFRRKAFHELHEYIYQNIQGVIATDLDYHLPLQGHPKYLGLTPNPVNVDEIAFSPLEIGEKINIFLGINEESYYKKGMDYFEKALEIIKEKYPEKIKIVISRSVPYALYIKLYDESHIVLDQAFAFDQGYNALEAMAKGKVVFTGAEKEFTKHYDLQNEVAINALPDENELANRLEELIKNPEQIIAIGQRARKFIEEEHDYISIAKKYLNVWSGLNAAKTATF